MEVSVRDFRHDTSGLYRLANVDYHACVGQIELKHWLEIAKRRLVEVLDVTCTRAKPDDRSERRRAVEVLNERVIDVSKRLGH